jgi:hypothetical protein
MSLHIIRSEDYDWIGLYRDGILLHEGHSIQEEDMLSILGLDYEHQVWTQEQFDEHGCRCPHELPGAYKKINVPGFGEIDRVGHPDPYGPDGEFNRKLFNTCSRCGTDEHTQFFNCDAMWGDGDLVCTKCKGYVRMRDSG